MRSRPELIFICQNEACIWYQKERFVPYRTAGIGLYEKPHAVVCECRPDYEMASKTYQEAEADSS